MMHDLKLKWLYKIQMSQKTPKGKYHDLLQTLVNQPDIIKHIMENDCCTQNIKNVFPTPFRM